MGRNESQIFYVVFPRGFDCHSESSTEAQVPPALSKIIAYFPSACAFLPESSSILQVPGPVA